ncbi:aminotransferase class III-fold pyridoxal phosphate-dependent enzyme [Syntrophaceticus schinkii]|jgi:glutamate-1-semialdehyde 2,1-aminomutase|uniref:Aminotransferase n=1 Tax=Syntrophaceticus schinkii TaxID=499207 RepID=A0A0B7MJD7_9FIRM|nr:aminotransferase class III-fold pyridoxal phosphate-dependent enzyme [Syntrophaceticus schinkii]CEO87727.1 Aminotransferase [Syntrophaceticus schinkii]
MSNGTELYNKAKSLIPGGTQLLSKRPEMFLPEQWPSYYDRCKGAEIWDLDGKKYIDMSIMGVGTCILGYGDEDVDDAVRDVIKKGSMCTLNCPEEVELAEILCDLHPWADMVRYTRTGGEVITIALRIARAATGKDRVVFCGYHGWHDWYLSSNLADEKSLDGQLLPGLQPSGVPRSLKGTSIPFNYNEPKELDQIINIFGNEIAAIIMEPVRHEDPAEGFLEYVREIASKIGAVLIYDEVTSGWRMNVGGIHLLYNIAPDLAVFAKGISNGYPMAAVIGKREIMEAAQGSFISSTYWTERIGPVAALATIKKFQAEKVQSHLIAVGNRVREIWRNAAERYGLAISVHGIPPLSILSFDYPNGQAICTYFTQEMLARGFIASKAVYASFAHQDRHIESYKDAVEYVFRAISSSLEDGDLEKKLNGPIAHSGFKRLA